MVTVEYSPLQPLGNVPVPLNRPLGRHQIHTSPLHLQEAFPLRIQPLLLGLGSIALRESAMSREARGQTISLT